MRTPRHRIKSWLRRMWLMSKERSEALKRDNYTCQKCGVKKSAAKGKEQSVEVHHKKGINVWDNIIDLIQKELLCDPEDLITLCPLCHDEY